MTGARRVASAGVVVPAHNEEELLPACLAALREAAGVAGVPVRLLVVADACTDATAAVAAAGGAEVIRIRARNVGAARADVTVFRTQHGLWRLRRWWQRHRGPRRVR